MLNRILGILVVLAIGVLAYPFMFNARDRFSPSSETISMPNFPSAETQNETIKALQQDDKNLSLKVEDAPQKHSKMDYRNIAWVIQVGSYHNKVTALGLVNQLRAKGYNAFIHQSNAAFGKEVQVYVGPEGKKDSATTLASRLTKETKLSAVIKTYKLLSV